MKKYSLILVLIIVLSVRSVTQSKAQAPPPPPPLSEKIFVGGNFGASFSNSGTYVDISPIVGYRINEKLSVGAGPIYQYLNIPGFITGSNYGARTFVRHTIWQNIFAQAEYELVNIKYPTFDSFSGYINGYERRYVGSLFVGGGISQHLGGNVSLQLIALYNLNQTKYSPRDPLYLSMGFGVGL